MAPEMCSLQTTDGEKNMRNFPWQADTVPDFYHGLA
jgi:hypothetical protein